MSVPLRKKIAVSGTVGPSVFHVGLLAIDSEIFKRVAGCPSIDFRSAYPQRSPDITFADYSLHTLKYIIS